MKTQAQLDQYEAKIQNAVSTVKQIRENVFSVPSSRQGVYPHVVTTDETGKANYCTCEGHKYYGHCYHQEAVTRFVVAQQAVAEAEAIVSDVERWTKQGVSRDVAERVYNAKPAQAHGNAKAYEPRAFSLLK